MRSIWLSCVSIDRPAVCAANESDDPEVAPSSGVFILPAPAVLPPLLGHFLFPLVFLTSPLRLSLLQWCESWKQVLCSRWAFFLCGASLQREKGGEMRYWFESLWEENNRSLTEATLKHKHLPCSLSVPERNRREKKQVKKQLCFLLLHLSPLAAYCG